MMTFEKRNFMGIELDVLVGHPEHDLLFVATQVAKAAGLKGAAASVGAFRKTEAGQIGATTLKEALIKDSLISLPKDDLGRAYRSTTAMASESWVYRLLLRGHAPQSEPFRKWVTEEVLPSIRKTGKYNAEESTNPIAQGIMDELKALRGELTETRTALADQSLVLASQSAALEAIRQELSAKTFNLEAPEVSPYVGQTMIALCDPAGFNARTYRELADYLPRPAVDKLGPRVVLHLEVELGKKTDGFQGNRLASNAGGTSMDMQRYLRWQNASQWLGGVEVFMIPLIQGLGRMDCQLQEEDQRYLHLPQEAQATIAENLRLNDRMTHSYLWVLGIYEFARTLHQRLREHELGGELQVVKQSINRLRIPLAKMEAAGRTPTDSPIAYPALNTAHGTAWQLTQTDFITRTDLADQLLNFLERFAEHQRALQAQEA